MSNGRRVVCSGCVCRWTGSSSPRLLGSTGRSCPGRRRKEWAHLRFEVTEEPSSGVDGGRWSHTPELGIFHAVTDVHGNVLVPEDRIRAAIETGHNEPGQMLRELDLALGRAWDDELEPFRYAGDGAPVRWLHRVA